MLIFNKNSPRTWAEESHKFWQKKEKYVFAVNLKRPLSFVTLISYHSTYSFLLQIFVKLINFRFYLPTIHSFLTFGSRVWKVQLSDTRDPLDDFMANWRQQASTQDISSSFCRMDFWMSARIFDVKEVFTPYKNECNTCVKITDNQYLTCDSVN